jgi:hypothetical protein
MLWLVMEIAYSKFHQHTAIPRFMEIHWTDFCSMYYSNLQVCFALSTNFAILQMKSLHCRSAHLHSYCCRFCFMDFHFKDSFLWNNLLLLSLLSIIIIIIWLIRDGRVYTQFRYQTCSHNFPTTHLSYAVCAKNM